MRVENMNGVEFITYGIEYDPNKFEKAKNRKACLNMNKPFGGFWSSPINSDWGWKNWCMSEDFRTDRLDHWTKFKLKPEAKIIIIDSLNDFREVLNNFCILDNIAYFDYKPCIDFEKITKEGYDGVLLTESGNIECHLPMEPVSVNGKNVYVDLNTWDCESMVLLRNDNLEVLEIKQREAK